MISNTDLIIYLRSKFAEWDKPWSVDAAVNRPSAEDKSRLPLPCLYVSVSPIIGVNESDGDYLQTAITNIHIELITLSIQDRTGKQGQESAHYAMIDLIKALCNKKLKPNFNEVYFDRSDFLGVDNARYYHTYDFKFTSLLDLTYVEAPESVDLTTIDNKYNLVGADPLTLPNAEDLINNLQE